MLPYCGDIHVNANDGLQNFVIEAGSVYQVQKTAWWLSGGRWVPKTVSYWMNDKGAIYSIQSRTVAAPCAPPDGGASIEAC